jgi:hypothetical protein
VAVRKGRKNTFSLDRGTVMPRNRVLGPVGKAIIFELPEATSGIRTTARAVDISAVTVKSLDIRADLKVSTTGQADAGFDSRLLVVRPVGFDGRLRITVFHISDLRPDSRTAVFGLMERPVDGAVIVLHRLMTDADVKQKIYVYLFRESHEIQV